MINAIKKKLIYTVYIKCKKAYHFILVPLLHVNYGPEVFERSISCTQYCFYLSKKNSDIVKCYYNLHLFPN